MGYRNVDTHLSPAGDAIATPTQTQLSANVCAVTSVHLTRSHHLHACHAYTICCRDCYQHGLQTVMLPFLFCCNLLKRIVTAVNLVN